MALYLYYHHGYMIGTFLLIKAADPIQADERMRQELSHPKYLAQDLYTVTGYELAPTDENETKYENLVYQMNVNQISRHGTDQNH